jgi:signal transduction histidine kinase
MLLAVAAAVALGLYVGARRASAAERVSFARQHETLVAERTAAEERMRIARELHDVVAHTLSLIVVQSEVLSANMSEEGLRAEAAAIAELGRGAMGELHRTLELLRGEGQAAALSPQPGLADLEQLLEQTRRAGLVVDLSVEGTPRALPASVELSAYRIVQEALTNARKHAQATRAGIRVRYGLEALELSIEDDGAAADVHVDGHGLRGMRERAAMLGGAVIVGPLDEGGYRVTAILPYGSEQG